MVRSRTTKKKVHYLNVWDEAIMSLHFRKNGCVLNALLFPTFSVLCVFADVYYAISCCLSARNLAAD